MAEESSTNDQSNTTTNDEPSGILPSNNFLGLLPPPYSMSALKTSLSSLQNSTPSSSASSSASSGVTAPYTNKYSTMASSNNTNTPTSFMYRSSSSLGNDSNNQMTTSFSMPSSSYRSFSKPPLLFQTREKEKLELSSLNDKFADYVEKVRYLEAQNRKVQIETGVLNEKQKTHCQSVKTMFESEIAQLREFIEKMFKEKNSTVYAVKEAQNGLVSLRQRLNQTFKECDSSKYETEKLERQLSNVDGDVLMFKRRLAHQDDEQTKWKQIIAHIQRLLLQAKNETQNEILSRSTCEQTVKQLRSDLAKLREEQQDKFRDLKQSTFQIGHNVTNDRAHIFKSELSSAIRKIRQDFEAENEQQRNELYLRFTQTYDSIARENPEIGHLFLNEREQERIKQEEDRLRVEIQRIKADSNQLKQKNGELKLRTRELQINLEMMIDENGRFEKAQQNEIDQLKLKQERVSKDYDEVISKQSSLEKEIETYRNLLEGTMKTVVDTITDEYNNVNTTNSTKTNPPPTSVTPTSSMSSSYISSPRTPRSVSVDRNSSSSSYFSSSRLNGYGSGSGSNLFSRFSPNRFSTNQSNHNPIQIDVETNEQNSSNGLSTSKSVGDLTSKTDFPMTIIETTEIETASMPTNNLQPTLIENR